MANQSLLHKIIMKISVKFVVVILNVMMLSSCFWTWFQWRGPLKCHFEKLIEVHNENHCGLIQFVSHNILSKYKTISIPARYQFASQPKYPSFFFLKIKDSL